MSMEKHVFWQNNSVLLFAKCPRLIQDISFPSRSHLSGGMFAIALQDNATGEIHRCKDLW